MWLGSLVAWALRLKLGVPGSHPVLVPVCRPFVYFSHWLLDLKDPSDYWNRSPKLFISQMTILNMLLKIRPCLLLSFTTTLDCFMSYVTTVTEEPDSIFLRKKQNPWRRKMWMPVFREKWQVMAVDAELHIRVVTMELLLSKGTPV